MTARELVARLEGASEGSRELNGAVEVAVRGVMAARTGLDRKHWAKWVSHRGTVSDGATTYAADPVTTSLDAALALASRVLPCWSWSVGQNVHHGYWHAYALTLDTDRAPFQPTSGTAKTGPLALCIAILKATATQPSDDGEKT